MTAARIFLGGLVAPIPVVLISDTADRCASIVLVVAVILVGLVVLVSHVIAELALQRECTRPLDAAEPVEVDR